MPELLALTARCLISSSCIITPGSHRGHGCTVHFPFCRGGLLPGSQRKECVILLPQGQSSGIFPIPVLFPTWYFALHCTASSSARGEGQPALWELREKEQKHPQGETVWHKGMFKHKYPQLKAKHRKYGLALSSRPWVTLQKPGGSSGQPAHQD